MSLFLYPVFFLLGLAAGSFLNCIIHRLQTGEGFLFSRSHCPCCQHQLGWSDLIPILSFFILKGKCRYCQKKISWQYPLVEIATGLLFLLMFWHFGFRFDLIFGFLILSFLIIIFVYDLKHYLIPDKIIYPAIIVTFIYNLLRISLGTERFSLSVFWAALGAAGFFLAIVLISQGKWMGIGDIKLGFLMGLLLGWPSVLLALFLAFLTGAIIGVGLIGTHKKSLKSEVPFGPFLVAGTLVAMFWGQKIINWYLSFLMI